MEGKTMKQPDHIITCVYCGQTYPENTPTHGANVKVLTEHIKVCPEHPMRAMREALEKIYNGGKLYGGACEVYSKMVEAQNIAKHALGL